ncbi:retroviral-like aspartic protease family protein [Myxococcota bacterium]|nr:retroviral-like aspartic protease family protein [Myxococcota bacterium]MBU1380584.1 retroviral-like aspartic protease family protein [Myxococcota bacterium]MBU1497162.1 retroviral-like aspartic protease family protein [Myxococcota bacterium]
MNQKKVFIVFALFISVSCSSKSGQQNGSLNYYARGNIEKAVEMMADSNDNSERALVFITKGKFIEALALEGNSRILLEYKSVAAWRAGRGDLMCQTVKRLRAFKQAPADLFQMAKITGCRRDFRRVVIKGGEVRFDPKFGIPIISVNISGNTYNFIFDTGAELTTVDEKLLKEMKVKTDPEAVVKVKSNVGVLEMPMGLMESMIFAGVEIRDLPVIAANLSGFPAFLKISGILSPSDILRGSTAELDYSKGTLRIANKPLKSGQNFFYPWGRAVIAVKAGVKNGPSALFRIDTGGRRSIFTKHYDNLMYSSPLWKTTSSESRKVVGLKSGRRKIRAVLSPEICTTSTCIKFKSVLIDTTSADSLITYGGKLGADAFRSRILTMDYKSMKLTLTNSTVN